MADENFIKREALFRQVLKEVRMAGEYLDWLIASSAEAGTELALPPTELAVAVTSEDVLELLGGGAAVPSSSSIAVSPSSPSPSSQPLLGTAEYRPALRTDLGSTVLLSGTDTDTLDTTLLATLNNNFFGAETVPNFNFQCIRALVPDVASARKKVIGREARYGGLLDKLVIEQSTAAAGILPSQSELVDVSSWIIQLTSPTASLLPQIAELAKNAPALTNLIVMIVANGVDSCAVCQEGWNAIVDAASNGRSDSSGETNNFQCTLLAMDEIYDAAQGDTMQNRETGYFHIQPMDFNPPHTIVDPPRKMSTRNAYRLLGHALALNCTKQKALVAYEYFPTEVECLSTPVAQGEFAVRDEQGADVLSEDVYGDVKLNGRLIQAMREAGFTPVMELDVLVGKGLAAYKEYIANPPDKVNAFGFGSSSSSDIDNAKIARDEQDEKIMAMLEEQSAARRAKEDAEKAEKRKVDIEGIAKEWATKEYTLRMLNGDIADTLSEKDFLISVWDEALVEGTKAYDFINSEDYVLEKARKKQAMVDVEDRLFWDGMPPLLRKKREKMVERVKKQYMDLLSEEELEKIILTSE